MPLLFVILILALLIPIRVSSHSSVNHVVISEISVAGTVANDEFVELYNPTDCPVDLAGYRLVRKTASGATEENLVGSLSGLIPAHGYFLIASPEYAGALTADLRYSTGSRLAINNTIILFANQQKTIIADKVGMGSAGDREGTAVANPVALGSIERLPGDGNGNGQDTGDNNADFRVRVIANPQNSSSSAEPMPNTCTAPLPPPPTPLPAPPPPPLGDVAGSNVVSIGTARQAPLGSGVTTSGTVTASPGQLSGSYLYIEDDSGGIQIYSSKKSFPQLTIGDVVTVYGTTSEAYKERRVKIESEGNVIRAGRASILPRSRKTGQINEDVEGRLVRLSGTVVQTSGNTFYINDGSGDARIYIKNETGIDKPAMAKGDSVIIIGIVSQYNNTYRVMPRLQSDIDVAKADVKADHEPDSGAGNDTASGAEDSVEEEAEIAGVTFASPTVKTTVAAKRPAWQRKMAYMAISLGAILVLLVPLLLWIKKKYGSLDLPRIRDNSSGNLPRY